VKPTHTERKVIIEQHKRFSKSMLWRLQREYFDKEGANAWVNQVPFYITSNPYIAASYAKIVLAFMRDWIKTHPEAKNQPFYIMELGTGSGRFSYYFIKTLLELLEGLQLQDIKFCYIMSDFTKHNIQYWEDHHALKPYIEQGLVDFVLYDMEAERPLHLMRRNVQLSAELLVNPLTVFANYIFDTISHDAFTIHENKLYELLFNLHTDETNMAHNRPVSMEKIGVDYNIHEIKSAYYGDPHLDAILDLYKKELRSTSFLIPIGSIHAIKFLRKLCNDKLFILSTDKGYTAIPHFDNLGHPTISFHGSFSMMVNFHAISEYFKNSGGDAFLQTPRKGIRTIAFASGFKINDMPEMRMAIVDGVERLSPSDYFTLHSRVRDHFNTYDLDTLVSHLEFANWDPHIYLKVSSRINSLLAEADPKTLELMIKNMPRLAANYYYMPKTECILFEIGMFFHAIKHYERALYYYQQSQSYVGEQFGLFFNMGLCAHYLGKNEEALVHFKHALTLDPESKETQEWITLIESGLKGEKANYVDHQ
jgi:tetratricopeptide (TPR) repeat protein